MLFKFFSAFKKEWLILTRDFAGLMLLFIMPMVMVTILSLVQEFGWSTLTSEPQVPVLFVDTDHDTLGTQIEQGFIKSGLFKAVRTIGQVPVTQKQASDLVLKGKYQIAMVIPEHATQRIRHKIQLMVAKTMTAITMPGFNPLLNINNTDSIQVIVYFDPAVKNTFKNAFISSLKENNARIESKMIFSSFNEELKRQFPQFNPPVQEYDQTVSFQALYPAGKADESIPTSTQHNVPAWAIFAMFFIVIPLTSSIIKEREEGSILRLMTMPVSYFTLYLAKIGVYTVVCYVQFILMMLSGIYLLPLLGLAPLNPGNQYILLSLVAIITSLAALGYGIMIGSIARTHQQAAAFGSVSIVILAALGGLWVPIYIMPPAMKVIATFSPLNWAHAAFIDIFLRGSNFAAVAAEVAKLFGFFACTITVAVLYRKYHSHIG